MPAHPGDPRINERREQPAIEEDAGDDAREEGEGELDLAHRALARLTARAYPGSQQAWGPGCRGGSNQRAVMPPRVGPRRADGYLADWAMQPDLWPGPNVNADQAAGGLSFALAAR
jgi:hypothetical protein